MVPTVTHVSRDYIWYTDGSIEWRVSNPSRPVKILTEIRASIFHNMPTEYYGFWG